jgi:hypothetical protein
VKIKGKGQKSKGKSAPRLPFDYCLLPFAF